jgi:RHS repeat-associated protein
LSGGYRYGFNGKENDNEVKGEGNQQDYGMRIYDGRIGKFLSVDPLYKDYAELTPYQFSSNNPVYNIDLDGLEGTGGANKLAEQTAKTTLRVATKYGVEQGAKVVAMKAAEKVVESPSFWGKLGIGALKVAGKFTGVVGWVFTPISSSEGDVPNLKNRPWVKPITLPNPDPNNDDGDNNKPKIFYTTYTKTKLNDDGTTSTYSGRTSGTFTGLEPTQEDAERAVKNRENGHLILKQEGYSPATLDKYSRSKAAIRGREQQLIDFYGGAQSEGGSSRNKIRGVGRNNPLRPLYNAAATASYGTLPTNNPADNKNP